MEMPVLLAAWMTLRASETAALDFATSINFKNHTMHMHRAMIKDAEGHFIIIERNKTIDSNRILHIPDYIYNKLKIISEKQEYVTNIKPHQYHQKLRRITDAAGLPPIRFHDLRHISTSVMLALGANDKIAQKRGGWSQNGNEGQNILKSVYQHTFSEQKQQADITIDECFNKPVSNQ